MAEVLTTIARARWLLRKAAAFERRADEACVVEDWAKAEHLNALMLSTWTEAHRLLRQAHCVEEVARVG